jgi:hypothetical protein
MEPANVACDVAANDHKPTPFEVACNTVEAVHRFMIRDRRPFCLPDSRDPLKEPRDEKAENAANEIVH